MELNKKTAIQITSVESPNAFRFRTKENEHKLNANIRAYVVSHSQNSKKDSTFVPKLNEMVIVQSNERIEIAEIKKVDNESDTFFCSFTNGNFCKVKRRDITPLTNQLANEAKNTILLGSIVGVAAVKMVSRKSEIIFVADLKIKFFINNFTMI